MGTFSDILKKVLGSSGVGAAAKKAAADAVSKAANKKETFTFTALPTSVGELEAMPEASLETPFAAAALTVCALCAYGRDRDAGIAMLNYLKGPQPLSPMELQFLRDRFMDGKDYVPVSYFEGAKPENNYTPAQPFRLTVSENPYSYESDGYAVLWLHSGGADSDRQVKLRRKGSENKWYLWEQYLLSDIRKPTSQDPWA